MKTLVVYYSWSNGNTEGIAKCAAKKVNADIAKIETEVPYTGTYDEVVEQAHKESKAKCMPKIKPLPYDVKDYDMVVVGTPVWWYTMAPAVRTFLHENDLKDKIVIPFMTNAGWPGTTLKDMKEMCGGADVRYEMEIRFDSSGTDLLVTKQRDIEAWLECIKSI